MRSCCTLHLCVYTAHSTVCCVACVCRFGVSQSLKILPHRGKLVTHSRDCTVSDLYIHTWLYCYGCILLSVLCILHMYRPSFAKFF